MTAPPDRASPTGFAFRILSRLSQISGLIVLWVVLRAVSRALIPYESVRRYLDQRAGDGSADLYTQAIHDRVVLGGSISVWIGILLAAAAWLYRGSLRGWSTQALTECRSCARRLCTSLGEFWRVIVVVTGAALIIRWPYLHLPMRFDESYSWLNYASAPIYVTVSKYDAPNNHVLHSLLEWISIRIFGEAPWTIRLPALMCGAAVAGVTSWWTAMRSGRWAGLVAGLLVACSSPLIEYSVNARGYTLSLLLLMGLWVLLEHWKKQPAMALTAWMAVLAALAMWTLPISLYGLIFVALGTWGEWSRDESLGRSQARLSLVLAAVAAVGLTVLLYLPIFIVWGVQAVAGSGQGTTSGAADWAGQFLQSLPEFGQLAFRDIPPPIAIGGAAVIGIRGLAVASSWRNTLVQLVAGLGICCGIVAVQRVVPPARSWLFLIPLLSATASGVVADTFQSKSWRQCGLVVLVVAWGIAPLIHGWRYDSISQSRETARFDSAEAMIVAIRPYLTEAHEPVIAVTPTSAPLAYYARQHGIADHHFFAPTESAAQQMAYVVTGDGDQSLASVLRELNLEGIYSQHRQELLAEWPDGRLYRLSPQ